MDYELETIKNIFKEKNVSIDLISKTSNKVYKIKTEEEILYAKFYKRNSTHIDNELKLYNLIDNKYLKEVYYKLDNPPMAIFKELVGKSVDELSKEELEQNSDNIIDSIYNYFSSISKYKVKGFGILDENLTGKSDDFVSFLSKRQSETSIVLKDYKELCNVFDLIMKKYKDIIISDNSLVPIDTNMKNIMVLTNGDVKFIDPGEMISGPILMGYGDLVAHTYKTILYDKLIKKLNLDINQEKLLRIYAICSSLNVLAFLKKNGVDELYKVIPFGNTYTFYELINEHLKYLELI